MVEKHTIIHIIEILGAVVCAHHFWPKGITYGEAEDWEKKHKNGHAKPSSRTARSKSTKSGSNSDHGRVRRRDREERYYDDRDHRDSRVYDERDKRGSRLYDDRERQYDYEERPGHSRRSSARY
jgi:hypothetical protein